MRDKKRDVGWEAMESALTDRDENGNIYGMTFFDEPYKKVYTPYFLPREDGSIRAATFVEEFEGGKTPEDLIYAEAYLIPGVDACGNVCNQYIFTDPVKNLSPKDYRAFCLGQQLLQEQIHVAKPQDEIHTATPPGLEAEETTMVEDVIDCPKNGCLTVMTKKGEYPLTNFRILPVEHRVVYGRNEKVPPTYEFELRIIYSNRIKSITIEPKDVENVLKKVQIAMPMCVITPDISKANALVTNFIRRKLAELPERTYIERTGFMVVQGQWVYIHDGATSPGNTTVFRTGKTIARDPKLNAQQACKEMLAFLNLSTKQNLMIPLLLYAHLGPLFKIFEAAGYVPRFLVFVAGRSGSLKTATCLCLFRLFAEQPDSPEATFKDTPTAMEIKLGEMNSHTLVIDDYRPPVSAGNSRQIAELLETIVRFVGDRISKSRSNPELGKAKEFAPTGCAIITGEDLGGTHSSLLRCLVLNVSKGDIDGNQLRRYQDNPLLLSTHMFCFLEWCGHNGDNLVNFIRSEFLREREFFSEHLQELRLVDTAATLILVARILISYAASCGAVPQQHGQSLTDTWRNVILQAVMMSETISKEANPVCLYLNAFFTLLEHGEIRIAASLDVYEAGVHDGYMKDDCAWLWWKEIYGKVRRYYQSFDQIFPLTVEQTSVHLADADLIEVVHEKGGTKRLFVKRSGLPSRARMMVLRVEHARKYLERESNS